MYRKLTILVLSLVVYLCTCTAAQDPLYAESGKFNMSYINYGITSSLIQNVDAAKGSPQVISPGYFELNADGSLHLSESLDTGFISAMKLRNIKVVPFLGNEWNQELGRMAMQNREPLSDQIAQAVRTYSLDGVNVDIENLTQADRDNLTDFVKMLRAKLPAGAEVSIAIGADPDGAYTTTTMYDNQAMSPYVDYFMLMAYDEHYPGDPEPGPVASLPYVEKSIQQALKQVPASQLVLGLPFYGRFWNGDPAYNGLGVSDQLAEKLIDTYHGVRTYDETSQSVKGTFTIGTADASVLLNGTPRPPEITPYGTRTNGPSKRSRCSCRSTGSKAPATGAWSKLRRIPGIITASG
ncbi:hypothetical protein LJK88_45735 [Paenibacillus sp. P26]|nr:hypothetical protein LJK88_45735 [Paenibacillus sp. P26]